MANQSTPIYEAVPESFLEILQADATAQPSPNELQADFERIMKMLDSFQSPSISVQPFPTTTAEQARGVAPPPIFIEQTYGQDGDASPERKRRYHQVYTQVDQPTTAGFATMPFFHIENSQQPRVSPAKRSRGEPVLRPKLRLDVLPTELFDSTTFPARMLLEDPSSYISSAGCYYFSLTALEPTTHKPIDTKPLVVDCGDDIKFDVGLWEKLPENKTFTVYVRVIDTSEQVLAEGLSRPITLLHDGLRDSPPSFTSDICFFPQKVVTQHLDDYNSKATLSKRHKKVKLKLGVSWCRNPEGCAGKKSCSCQAYPSRILKKSIRELKILLEKTGAPHDVVLAARELYSLLCLSADQQNQRIQGYAGFLEERLVRWKLFQRLQQYGTSALCVPEVRDKVAFIWRTICPQQQPATPTGAVPTQTTTATTPSAGASPAPALPQRVNAAC